MFTALFFSGKLKTFVFYQCICRLEDFFFLMLKILRSAKHGSTEDLVLMGSADTVRPWTVPNLGMAVRVFELWTGSNMGSSGLEFGLETGPSGVW